MSSAIKLWRKTKTRRVPQANASVAHTEILQAALRMTGLSIFEDIAYTSQGSDQGLVTIAIHLSAQAVDMHVHHVRIRLDTHAPDLVENHGTGNHPAGVAA
jgi:hypothetical protein